MSTSKRFEVEVSGISVDLRSGDAFEEPSAKLTISTFDGRHLEKEMKFDDLRDFCNETLNGLSIMGCNDD